MSVTRETLFLIEWGRQCGEGIQWEPLDVAYLLDAAIVLARAARERYPAALRVRRVNVVRTSEVLGEWDHGEPVNPEKVVR